MGTVNNNESRVRTLDGYAQLLERLAPCTDNPPPSRKFVILHTPLESAASMMARCDMLLSPGTIISVSSRGARLTRNTSELMAESSRIVFARSRNNSSAAASPGKNHLLHLLERGRKILQTRAANSAGFQEESPATSRAGPAAMRVVSRYPPPASAPTSGTRKLMAVDEGRSDRVRQVTDARDAFVMSSGVISTIRHPTHSQRSRTVLVDVGQTSLPWG